MDLAIDEKNLAISLKIKEYLKLINPPTQADNQPLHQIFLTTFLTAPNCTRVAQFPNNLWF